MSVIDIIIPRGIENKIAIGRLTSTHHYTLFPSDTNDPRSCGEAYPARPCKTGQLLQYAWQKALYRPPSFLLIQKVTLCCDYCSGETIRCRSTIHGNSAIWLAGCESIWRRDLGLIFYFLFFLMKSMALACLENVSDDLDVWTIAAARDGGVVAWVKT